MSSKLRRFSVAKLVWHAFSAGSGRERAAAQPPSEHDEGMRRGAAAERRFDFTDAVRHYLAAAESADSGGAAEIRALMRAASCLERQQNWRSHSAVWEKIGEQLGGQPVLSGEGQSGMYHIISYPSWEDALTDRSVSDAASPGDAEATVAAIDEARRSQQRAWAYQWAAESAQQEGRHGHARHLFRKAGLAFLDSAASTHWNARRDARARLYETAAGCFFCAAWCNWQPGSLSVPDLNPQRIGDGPEDRFNSSWTRGSVFEEYTRDDANDRATDLEWMRDTYFQYGKVVGSTALAYDCIAHRLSELQALLNLTGERRQSRRLYQMRRRAERCADLAEFRHPAAERRLAERARGSRIGRRLILGGRLARAYVGWALTGSNASLLRSGVALLVVYCVVFPALYLRTMVPVPGFAPDGTPRWLEALNYSLLTTVTLPSDRYTVVSVPGNLLEAAQGWSAFFALGYFIWLLTRQFDG